jgi:hypothetical protein
MGVWPFPPGADGGPRAKPYRLGTLYFVHHRGAEAQSFSSKLPGLAPVSEQQNLCALCLCGEKIQKTMQNEGVTGKAELAGIEPELSCQGILAAQAAVMLKGRHARG